MAEFMSSPIGVILLVILQVATIIGIVVFVNYLRKLAKKAGIEISDEQFQAINSIINDVIVYVNQKWTSVYKSLSPNGKLTEAQKIELFNKAKNIIMSMLTATQCTAIVEHYTGDLDTDLEILIEKFVSFNHDDYLVANDVVDVLDNLDSEKTECPDENGRDGELELSPESEPVEPTDEIITETTEFTD